MALAMNAPKELKETVEKLFPVGGSGHDPEDQPDFEDWTWETTPSD